MKGKFKKFLVKIGAAVLLVIMIGGVIVSIKEKKESENAIHIVQDGTSKINEDSNYKEAFEKYFLNVSWFTYKNSQGVRIVGFTGKRYMHDRDTMGDYEISYIVDENTNTFKFYKGTCNGIELNQIDMLKITISAVNYNQNNIRYLSIMMTRTKPFWRANRHSITRTAKLLV